MRYTGKSFDKTVNRRTEYGKFDIDTVMSVVQSIPVKEDGRVIYKSEIVDVDMAEEMKNYRVEDFYLENMIADGTIGQLNMVSVSVPGMKGIDQVVSQLPNIDNYLEKNIVSEE